VTCEQLDFDQYAGYLATQWLLEQEARRREYECRPPTVASRILEKFGFYTVYSEDDFFSNVNKGSSHRYRGTRCWEWTGKRTRDYWDTERPGYGEYGGMFAYRFAWTIIAGREYSKGRELHHMCEFRPCVNPDHLALLTHKQHGVEHAKLRRRRTFWLRHPFWHFTPAILVEMID
jgi:hypothetical protein